MAIFPFVLFVSALAAQVLASQGPAARIQGRVVDVTNAPIAGARVSVNPHPPAITNKRVSFRWSCGPAN